MGDVTDVATRTAARIERVLEQHGRYLNEPSDGSSDEQLWLDYPALASCYQAATSGRQLLDEHPGKPALGTKPSGVGGRRRRGGGRRP
ncbi:MAG: hypothetical protein MJD61_06305 [Proteobacteria bacterium]|nr:hypothetical protein [Pseudomonadota bacterium]